MEETETDPHPLEAFSRRAEVCYLTPAIDTNLLEVEIRAVGRAVF
jgi:hypothetical protein